MSRIDDLIRELCPAGVDSVRLGDVVKIKNGKDHKQLGNGEVPVYGSGGIMRFADANIAVGPTVLIPRKGSLGNLFFVEGPFWVVDTIFYTTINLARILPKFLYYKLTTMGLGEMNQAGGVPSQTQAALNQLRLQLPPLEVQREIVSIMDKFTQLEAELEAELEARRVQYEETRNNLLNFDQDLSAHPLSEMIRELCPEGVQVCNLGDLIQENLGGGTPSRSDASLWNGSIPWASVGDLTASELEIGDTRQSITEAGLASSSTNLIPEGWVVAAVKIAPGEMRVVRSPLAINQDLRGLRLSETVDPRFLVYLSKTISVKGNGTIVKGITNDSLKKLKIAVPPLEVQREIVSILDKLDALVNDISFGLPAEIAARRKQYEYYRNKLLTFKELDAA